MNRRQAKKILRRPGLTPARGYPAAIRIWERDMQSNERRQGRWSPVSRERLREHLQRVGERRLWWLSFVDTERPAGDKFLGACQVWADCGHNAIRWAHRLGCNPGGEVQFMAASPAAAMLVPEKYVGVLMSRHEVEIFDALMGEKIRDAKLVSEGVTKEPLVTAKHQPKETDT